METKTVDPEKRTISNRRQCPTINNVTPSMVAKNYTKSSKNSSQIIKKPQVLDQIGFLQNIPIIKNPKFQNQLPYF